MDFLRSGLRPSLRKSTVFYHKVTAILILFQLAIAICEKINLNKLGLIDSFAIDELTLRSELFDGDIPNIHRMKEYANSLSLDEPLRYAILDVIVW